MRKRKIRWKLLTITLPLMVLPLVFVGLIAGYIANEQAQVGIVEASRADLEHVGRFTIDLLAAHHRQFEVYKEDKRKLVLRDLETVTRFAYNLVAAQYHQQDAGLLKDSAARQEARRALKGVNIGETGYVYVLDSTGLLHVHPAQEDRNILEARDGEGRYFIKEIIATAKNGKKGEFHTIVYPWRNEVLGEKRSRDKVVVYKYFEPWDWIVAAGGYLEETYEDVGFEREAFRNLVDEIKAIKVGETGYVYAMKTDGTLTIHPFLSGQNLWTERDGAGNHFIRTMCQTRRGWIRYPWKNKSDPEERMKLVYYDYFEPWDWVVAVGSYEDEFYRPATSIGRKILVGVGALTFFVALIAVVLAFLVSKLLTDPIRTLTRAMSEVKRGRLDTRLDVSSDDELGDLARDFNHMIDVLRQNKELEASQGQLEKMASLGVLASEVAHEINNPLGVIMGYAGLVEGRLAQDDPNLEPVQSIKTETRRCKTIVQDLLAFVRVPRPTFMRTDLNTLLDQTIQLAGNMVDLDRITIERSYHPLLPRPLADIDQLRRVILNLILNACDALPDGGTLRLSTRPLGEREIELVFLDSGSGIRPEHLDKVFEPFFSTRRKGTGLGLAISKSIVEQHQGRIRVESEFGKGTTVTVTLPVDPKVRA
jgi:two-component system NtrC family sensor kinase